MIVLYHNNNQLIKAGKTNALEPVILFDKCEITVLRRLIQ